MPPSTRCPHPTLAGVGSQRRARQLELPLAGSNNLRLLTDCAISRRVIRPSTARRLLWCTLGLARPLIQKCLQLRAIHIIGLDIAQVEPGRSDQVAAFCGRDGNRRRSASSLGLRETPRALPMIRETGRAPQRRGSARGLRTRRISISAATGLGIEHQVQVVVMVSKAALANGICSAEP
jgi:hypothetical protein